MIYGCTERTITTVDEILKDADWQEKPWIIIASVRVDREAIREDISKILNNKASKSLRTNNMKWAWRDKTHLHLLNPSTVYFQIAPEVFIADIKKSIDAFQHNRATKFDELVGSYFDYVTIHYMENTGGRGLKENDTPTIIDDLVKSHATFFNS
jgi:hypothetical protein